MLGVDGDGTRSEVDLHAAHLVGPQDARARQFEPPQGEPARMAVRVPGTDRHDGDRRPDGGEEGRTRRGAAAVVGDLEHVDARQPATHQDRIDAFLGVAGQEEAATCHLAEEDDRDVVDARPGFGGRRRNGPRIRPQDAQRDVVEGQPIAGREPLRAPAPAGKGGLEGRVARPAAPHPGLEDATDPVATEQDREAAGVIVVGVGQDDEVEAAVPGRQPSVEGDEQAVGIGTAIDEQPPAACALDEDRVALSHVEDREPGSPGRTTRPPGPR